MPKLIAMLLLVFGVAGAVAGCAIEPRELSTYEYKDAGGD